MKDEDDWAAWVREHPPPNLQALVAQYGLYSRVPHHAWQDYDLRMMAWEEARKTRLMGNATWRVRAEEGWAAKKLRPQRNKR